MDFLIEYKWVLLGSLLVLVAGGGVWRAEEKGVFDAGTGPAYEPWQDWREGERRSRSSPQLSSRRTPTRHSRGLFTFRVGYLATAAPASPRRKVEAVSENVSA